MNKTLNVALALVLALSLVPAAAFADKPVTINLTAGGMTAAFLLPAPKQMVPWKKRETTRFPCSPERRLLRVYGKRRQQAMRRYGAARK